MDGARLPSPWGSPSARAVWAGLLCVLLLLLVPLTGHAQSEKPPTLQELQSSLLKANKALTTLVPLCQEQETRIAALTADSETLSQDLGILSTQLIASQADLVISEQERQRAADSLEKLWTQYGELSKSFQDYRTEMQKQVATLERERNGWRFMAIGGGALAIFAVIVAIVH